MLSIDETIVNEKEMEEGLREQYECMMECSDIFRKKKKVFIEQCKHDAEYHEQLAEWLEELKAYREEKCNKSVYLARKSIDKIDAVNKGYADGYNKAIDDLVKEICKMYVQSERNGKYRFYAVEIKQAIADLAEQLKEQIC